MLRNLPFEKHKVLVVQIRMMKKWQSLVYVGKIMKRKE